MTAVQNPAEYIRMHLESQTETNSRLRGLLSDMNKKRRVPGPRHKSNKSKGNLTAEEVGLRKK